MPFSSKLTTDYIELINHALDFLPIQNIEEFSLLIIALENIITPKPDCFCAHLTESIEEILNNPDSYVQDESNYIEFQNIIKSRIIQTINSFKKLSNLQKQIYIDNQKKEKEDRDTTSSQATQLAIKRGKPLLEHTTTYEETEEAFASRIEVVFRLHNRPTPNANNIRQIRRFLRITYFSLEQFLALDEDVQNQAIQYPYIMGKILFPPNSLKYLITMSPAQRAQLYQNLNTIFGIIPFVSLEDFFNIDLVIRNMLITHNNGINDLISTGLTLEQFIQLGPEKCLNILKNIEIIASFIRQGSFCLADFISLSPEIYTEAIQNNFLIRKMIPNHISSQDFMHMISCMGVGAIINLFRIIRYCPYSSFNESVFSSII